MEALKYLKVDYIITKTQVKIALLFSFIALLMIASGGSILTGASYACFGGLIFSTTPFLLEQRSYCGFTNMLPASILSRVIGRYLYGVGFMLFGMIPTILCYVIMYLKNMEELKSGRYICLLALAVGIFCMSIQYLILYCLGNINNTTVMSLLRVVPGFIIFFSAVRIEGEMKDSINLMNQFLENIALISVVAILVSIFTLCITTTISYVIYKNRDFC